MKAATAGSPDPMKDGKTRDQRFFLGWASVWRRKFTPDELKVRVATDAHAPAGFRAIGAPSNLPAFQTAFQCTDTQPMVRAGERRIVIW
jgi:putative endopeptidase